MKIKGDPKHFHKQTLEAYRVRLAEMLAIEKHDVIFENLTGGSIILIFLIPSNSTVDLIKLALNYDPRLIDMGVIGVQVQGEDYIPLDDINKGKLPPKDHYLPLFLKTSKVPALDLAS